MISTLSTLLALASLVVAQAPTAASLALVDAQFASAGFPLNTNAGFGTTLKSTAALTVTYGFGAVQNGNAYTVAQVATLPTISVTPLTPATAGTKYTVILADASSLGDPDPQGNFRHYLANSQTGSANATFSPTGGIVITSYAAPGPLVGTGPHRYAWLVLTEGATFTAPSNLSTAGAAPGHWSVSSFVKSTGVNLIAASFFTVQNGTPTGAVSSTQAVNTATSATTATRSGTASGSGTGTATGTTAAATGTTTAPARSSGEKLIVSALMFVGLGLALM